MATFPARTQATHLPTQEQVLIEQYVEAYNFWNTLIFFLIVMFVLGALRHPVVMSKALLTIVASLLGIVATTLLLMVRMLAYPFRKLTNPQREE